MAESGRIIEPYYYIGERVTQLTHDDVDSGHAQALHTGQTTAAHSLGGL